jgi:hypothetical protein
MYGVDIMYRISYMTGLLSLGRYILGVNRAALAREAPRRSCPVRLRPPEGITPESAAKTKSAPAHP